MDVKEAKVIEDHPQWNISDDEDDKDKDDDTDSDYSTDMDDSDDDWAFCILLWYVSWKNSEDLNDDQSRNIVPWYVGLDMIHVSLKQPQTILMRTKHDV